MKSETPTFSQHKKAKCMARPSDPLAQPEIHHVHVAVARFPFVTAQQQDFLQLSHKVYHSQHVHSLGQCNSGFSYKQMDCTKGPRGWKITSYT